MNTKYKIIIPLFIILTAQILFFLPTDCLALEFKPNVDIPGYTPKPDELGKVVPGNEAGKEYVESSLLGNYINAIYRYGLGIVGIVSAVVLMVGGVIWIVSMGSSERVNLAKSYIISGVSGLALMMCGYTILYVINPDLVKIQTVRIEKIQKVELGCCEVSGQTAVSTNKKDCEAKSGSFKEDCIPDGQKCIKNESGCCSNNGPETFQIQTGSTKYFDCRFTTASDCDTDSYAYYTFHQKPCNEINSPRKCPQYGSVCNGNNDGTDCSSDGTSKVCFKGNCDKCESKGNRCALDKCCAGLTCCESPTITIYSDTCLETCPSGTTPKIYK